MTTKLAIKEAHEQHARNLEAQKRGIPHRVYDPLTGKSEVVMRRYFSWEFAGRDPMVTLFYADAVKTHIPFPKRENIYNQMRRTAVIEAIRYELVNRLNGRIANGTAAQWERPRPPLSYLENSMRNARRHAVLMAYEVLS